MHHNLFDETRPTGQADIEALIHGLIKEVAVDPRWENVTVDDYVDAVGRWLSSKRTPPFESLERRLLGHVLFPQNCDRLEDYFEEVLARVRNPYEGWPAHLERPEPDWRVIGQAFMALRYTSEGRVGHSRRRRKPDSRSKKTDHAARATETTSHHASAPLAALLTG